MKKLPLGFAIIAMLATAIVVAAILFPAVRLMLWSAVAACVWWRGMRGILDDYNAAYAAYVEAQTQWQLQHPVWTWLGVRYREPSLMAMAAPWFVGVTTVWLLITLWIT